ncbi:hypothetical protein QW131_13015 [Roseibium salinum]|nr:hypothetical protein [Roseibium salinum]
MTKHVNLNPHHGVAGRHPTREFLDTLSGHSDPGKFGRMFPGLPALKVADAALQELAEAMVDNDELTGDNLNIPAGFTYLGQFIDHDITLDHTSLGEKKPGIRRQPRISGHQASTWTASTVAVPTAARISMPETWRAARPRNC